MVSRKLLTALLLSIAASGSFAQTPSAEGRREPLLTVLGRGRHEVKPDQAQFQATIVTDAKTLDDVAKLHELRATQALEMLQSLRSMGLEIEKSTFRIDERRVQRPLTQAEISSGKRPESFTEGYDARTSFSLKAVSLDNLNAVVTKVADSGLFTIDTVRFLVVQERAALNQARRAAMMDALEQARAYSEPVNLNLVQIVTVTDGEATTPDGQADLPARGRQAARYSVQIVPPAILEFTASANVTWRIEPR